MIKKVCEECNKEFYRHPSYFANRPGRFCSKSCELIVRSREWKINNPILHINNSGVNNPMYGKKAYNFKPEGSTRKDGYIRIQIGRRRLLLHRHIMEKHLGRELHRSEVVHHIDGNNTNNDITNLKIMTQSEHINLHRKELQTGKVINRR